MLQLAFPTSSGSSDAVNVPLEFSRLNEICHDVLIQSRNGTGIKAKLFTEGKDHMLRKDQITDSGGGSHSLGKGV